MQKCKACYNVTYVLEAKFCPMCGGSDMLELPEKCSYCHFPLAAHYNFCSGCGRPTIREIKEIK